MISNNVLEVEHSTGRVHVPATSLRKGWLALTALILATLTVMVDNTVLNVALPSISDHLHAGTSQLQWIVNAYSLMFGGLLLTGGSLADRLGRRRVLLGGLAAFAAISTLVLVVRTAPELIALRAMAGAAAAFLMPSTVALMYRSFEGPARATAIGIAGAVAGLGFVIGPLLGGALLEVFPWQGVFIVNVPLALLALSLGRAAIPADIERTGARADLLGGSLSVMAMAGLVGAIISGPDHGWTSALVVLLGAVSVCAAAGFVWWELRAPHPMLDVRALGHRALVGPAVSQGALLFATAGALFLITQQLQILEGHSPIDAGLRTAPIAVGLIAAGPLLTWSARALGTPTAAALGLLLTATGMLLVALSLEQRYLPLALGLAGVGAGVRVTITIAALAVLDGLPDAAAGIGAALGDTFQEIGGALGVALLGSIFYAVYRSDLPPGAPSAARVSLQGALNVRDAALHAAARHAFVDGAHTALIVCAGLLVAVAVVARLTVPAGLDITEAA